MGEANDLTTDDALHDARQRPPCLTLRLARDGVLIDLHEDSPPAPDTPADRAS